MNLEGGESMELEKDQLSQINISGFKSIKHCEIKFRKALFHAGFRYIKNDKQMIGKPDIILPKYKTIIFIHGVAGNPKPVPTNILASFLKIMRISWTRSMICVGYILLNLLKDIPEDIAPQSTMEEKRRPVLIIILLLPLVYLSGWEKFI